MFDYAPYFPPRENAPEQSVDAKALMTIIEELTERVAKLEAKDAGS